MEIKSEMKEMKWSLGDTGMGILHRAGLASLFMTLKAAEEQQTDLSPLEWSLTPHSVTLRWEGLDADALVPMFKFAWQLKDKVFYLPGIHREQKERDHSHLRITTHNGLMGTFFQHNRVQPRDKAVGLVITLDEDKQSVVQYLPIDPQLHYIKPVKDLADDLINKGNFRKNTIPIERFWAMPGSAQRYSYEKAWIGEPESAFLLMLAPIACMFMRIKSSNWVYIVPDVRDLDDFNEARPRMNLDISSIDVAGLGDAGLRFAVEYATRKPRRQTGIGCKAVAMGNVTYYPNQKVRKQVMEFLPTPVSVLRYQILLSNFPNRYIPPNEPEKGKEQDGTDQGYFKTPSSRGRIADNIVSGNPWYLNLFDIPMWDAKSPRKSKKVRREIHAMQMV